MKPQADAFLEKGRDMLNRAEIMLRAGLNEDAGRTAYFAGFHAAQALIFERDGRVLKTQKGVQSELRALSKTIQALTSIVAPSSARPIISKRSQTARPAPGRK